MNQIEVKVMAWDEKGRQAYGRSASFLLDSSPGNRDGAESDALADASHFRKPGLMVLVRPLYNDNAALDFHEWRSFDGGPFQRCDFNWYGNDPVQKA